MSLSVSKYFLYIGNDSVETVRRQSPPFDAIHVDCEENGESSSLPLHLMALFFMMECKLQHRPGGRTAVKEVN